MFFGICPICNVRFLLHHRQDHETLSTQEVAQHIQEEHPESCPDEHAVPYIFTESTTYWEGVDMLSKAFTTVIRSWGTVEQLVEIDRLNGSYSELPKDDLYHGCCATADTWDSNMAMHEAWCNVFHPDGPNVASERDMLVWDAAWDLSKRRGFAPTVAVPAHWVEETS